MEDNVPWGQTNQSQGRWGCRNHPACSGGHPQAGREKARCNQELAEDTRWEGLREGGGEGRLPPPPSCPGPDSTTEQEGGRKRRGALVARLVGRERLPVRGR